MRDEDDDEIARGLPKPPLRIRLAAWVTLRWLRSAKGQAYMHELVDAVWSRMSSPTRQVLGGVVLLLAWVDGANVLPPAWDNVLEALMTSVIGVAIITRSQKKATTLSEAEERLVEAHRKAEELAAKERAARLDAATGGTP